MKHTIPLLIALFCMPLTPLPAGPTELVTYLIDKNGRAGGAYFTEVECE